jgi:hypothetical protein
VDDGAVALLLVCLGIVAFFALIHRLATSVDETNSNGDHGAWTDGEHHWTDHGPSH